MVLPLEAEKRKAGRGRIAVGGWASDAGRTGCKPWAFHDVAGSIGYPVLNHAARHTSQIWIAWRREVSGSRLGMNSWATKPLKPLSAMARITAG